jgi:UDP-galactopyranose mutase
VSERGERLFIAVPHLPSGQSPEQSRLQLRGLVDELVNEHVSRRFVAWYYTPMALAFSDQLKPAAVVYDCMDELSNFKAAPPEMRTLEDRLFRLADVVFTGGYSLYEQKCSKHINVHPFPSSVDSGHFRKARKQDQDPQDQSAISLPRIGYSGVIDERLDIELVGGLAAARPDWQFVMLGPVVKIDPSTLPHAENIHYLGPKPYSELPAYLSGWDVAIMPFARNEATRFISPTKTPEYLAAGRRVVSTSIRDVVRSYGEAGLVLIADAVHSFGSAIEESLQAPRSGPAWIAQVDAYLERMSWNQTFYEMWRLVEKSLAQRAMRTLARPARARVPAPAFAGSTSASNSPSGTADVNVSQ